MPQSLRWLAVLVLAVGCGAVQEAADASGDFTLVVSPGSLEIPIASERTATLTVDRSGTAGDIVLSAENVPAGFEVTFIPSTISSTASTSEVRVAVAGGSMATSASISIVGSGGGAQHTATLDVTSTTIMVTGRVRGNRSGIAVRIVGKATTTSDATGSFVFTDVTPPYDLYTVGVEQVPGTNQSPAVVYYRGLTRPDPVVVAPEIITATSTPFSSATVNGTKTGGDAINERLIVWSGGGSHRGSAATYSFMAQWPGTTSNAGTLYGLQWTKRANGAPDTFIGYGSTVDTLTPGSTRTLNLALTAPAMATLTGTVTPPAGFPDPELELRQQFGDSHEMLWSSRGATNVAATIPLVAAGTSTLFARASLGTGADMARTVWAYPALAASTDVTFALPVPPVLSAPLAAASGVTTTTPFAFASAPTTVHVARITTTGTNRAIYTVYTTETTLTIPDVPELPLPAAQAFTWRVDGYGPHTHVDEVATEVGVINPLPFAFDALPPHYGTTSPTRSFTSAP